MAKKTSKKKVKPTIKDLKGSKKRVSEEESAAVKGGAYRRPLPIMADKDPTKTYPSSDMTMNEDGEVVDFRTD